MKQHNSVTTSRGQQWQIFGNKLGFTVKQTYNVQMKEDRRNWPEAIVSGMYAAVSISDETCHVIENGKLKGSALKKMWIYLTSPKSSS